MVKCINVAFLNHFLTLSSSLVWIASASTFNPGQDMCPRMPRFRYYRGWFCVEILGKASPKAFPQIYYHQKPMRPEMSLDSLLTNFHDVWTTQPAESKQWSKNKKCVDSNQTPSKIRPSKIITLLIIWEIQYHVPGGPVHTPPPNAQIFLVAA